MKQFNMGSQVINWDSEIFNNKKVVTPPRFWFLNDLVYIHLCDLTWATPRIFCWQDDRRSRSDLSSQGQVDSVQCLLQCQLRRWKQPIINNLVHGLFIAIIKDQYSHQNITLLSGRWILSAKNELSTNGDQLSQSNTRDSMIGPKSFNNNFFQIHDSDNYENLTKYL